MPKMKFREPLHHVLNRSEEYLKMYRADPEEYPPDHTVKGKPYWLFQLEVWGLPTDDIEGMKACIQEEYDALLYLCYCGDGLLPNEYAAVDKPIVEVVHRAIDRHLAHLERVYKVTLADYRKLNHRKPGKEYLMMIKKQFECCRYYRFQVTLPGWYAELPERCVPVNQRYGEEFEDNA